MVATGEGQEELKRCLVLCVCVCMHAPCFVFKSALAGLALCQPQGCHWQNATLVKKYERAETK